MGAQQDSKAHQVLVVLQHQSLGGVRVQGVVGRTDLDQLVELPQEIELGLASNEGQGGVNVVVPVFGIDRPHVHGDGRTLDDVAKLGQHVLGQQPALVGEQFNIAADGVV